MVYLTVSEALWRQELTQGDGNCSLPPMILGMWGKETEKLKSVYNQMWEWTTSLDSNSESLSPVIEMRSSTSSWEKSYVVVVRNIQSTLSFAKSGALRESIKTQKYGLNIC